jgi:hypothetical protein
MTGTLKISTKSTLPDALARRIVNAVESLSSLGMTIQQQPDDALDVDILIDVIEMGDISHEHIKPFLLMIFPGEREIKGVTAVLRDSQNNKLFEVPCDSGECVDWFKKE